MPKHNRAKALVADQKLIDGVSQFLSHLASLPVGSKSVTPADIIKVLQDRLASSKAVNTTDAAHQAAVNADRDERASTSRFIAALRLVIMGMFSNSPDTLAVFGMSVRKTGKPSATTLANAAAKNKATREARHTLGKKARLKVQGVVPAEPKAPAVTPPTTIHAAP